MGKKPHTPDNIQYLNEFLVCWGSKSLFEQNFMGFFSCNNLSSNLI